MEDHEADLIDYLNVVWKRKYLIIGGTLLTSAVALVVSLSMPKTYEVSRTLRVGRLAGSKVVEKREVVIDRLRDHRVLKMLMEKVHSGNVNTDIGGLVSISSKPNRNIRYTVQAHDPEAVVQIADKLAGYIIKVHKAIYERGLQIAKEYEAELAGTIRKVEAETQSMKMVLKTVMEAPKVDTPAVILLQANVEDRERNLTDLRRELKGSRLSRLGSENTSVIAADAPPKHAVKPRIKLNVALAGVLGLMMFTFGAFFMEYIEKARSDR